ncbi:hypothetical protein [Clostridium grantii]|uniref:Uncharacterized protein n=1 Tax=Clostridium grantii DSM 8605 TaxID=1121316 RepID=A0A1M5Y4W7_9CLOT|nr:hypothetical protein [Clostridium grantii]SHI07101.1 hypothetical protein SAMN02745207_04200 [Clostridium grantii DSM 8605]
MNYISVLINCIIGLLMLGGIVLQYNLGKKGARWTGLVLPSILFIFSMIIIGNIIYNDITIYGNISAEILQTYKYSGDSSPNIQEYTVIKELLRYGVVSIILNLPTCVYLSIYLISKRIHQS